MKKKLLNKYFRKFGFEVHGVGYIQSVEKNSFKEDPFLKQKELSGHVSTIFDIGANWGDTALEYKAKFPSAKIYAFEPFPVTFEAMKGKVSRVGNIFPYQVAIGEQAGKSTFYVNNNVETNSLLPLDESGLGADKKIVNIEKIEVDVWTVDQFCETNGIQKIDILKMDIQGGELAALKGCRKLLAGKKIGLIYSETFFIKLYVGNPLFHDISKYLEEFNYHVQDFYSPMYSKGSIAWCDVIFLPNK